MKWKEKFFFSALKARHSSTIDVKNQSFLDIRLNEIDVIIEIFHNSNPLKNIYKSP